MQYCVSLLSISYDHLGSEAVDGKFSLLFLSYFVSLLPLFFLTVTLLSDNFKDLLNFKNKYIKKRFHVYSLRHIVLPPSFLHLHFLYFFPFHFLCHHIFSLLCNHRLCFLLKNATPVVQILSFLNKSCCVTFVWPFLLELLSAKVSFLPLHSQFMLFAVCLAALHPPLPFSLPGRWFLLESQSSLFVSSTF